MTTTRRSQEERRIETRSRLITATIDVINDKGYAAMRTTDITKKAAMTWGAVQHLFGSRADLMMEVSLSASDALVGMLEENVAQDLPHEKRLEAIIDHTWKIYSSAPYFAMVEIIRGTRKDPKIHDRLVQAQKQISRKIERLWLRAFGDTKDSQHVSAARIKQVCNLVTLFLSGLAARKIYFLPSTETRAQISYIKQVAIAEMNRKS